MAQAKIDNGVVVQIKRGDGDLRDGWTECADDVVCGMIFLSGVFLPPPAPSPSPAELAAALRDRLAALDIKTIRPLRAVFAAQAAEQNPDPTDVARLADLNAQAAALRAQLVG